jgi:Pseudouridine synthase II TruB, C-terminal
LPDSITLEELEIQQQSGIFTPVSPNRGLAHLPEIILTDDGLIRSWSQGQRLSLDPMEIASMFQPGSSNYVRVVAAECCIGIGEIQATEIGHRLVPQTVLNPT